MSSILQAESLQEDLNPAQSNLNISLKLQLCKITEQSFVTCILFLGFYSTINYNRQTKSILHNMYVYSKALLVPQVSEVEEGHEGSGDDDHPWFEAACHKLFVAKISPRMILEQ